MDEHVKKVDEISTKVTKLNSVEMKKQAVGRRERLQTNSRMGNRKEKKCVYL